MDEAEKVRKDAEQEWFQPFLESLDENKNNDEDTGSKWCKYIAAPIW